MLRCFLKRAATSHPSRRRHSFPAICLFSFPSDSCGHETNLNESEWVSQRAATSGRRKLDDYGRQSGAIFRVNEIGISSWSRCEMVFVLDKWWLRAINRISPLFSPVLNWHSLCLHVLLWAIKILCSRSEKHVVININAWIFYSLWCRAIGGWRGAKRPVKKATFHRTMLLSWNPSRRNRE